MTDSPTVRRVLIALVAVFSLAAVLAAAIVAGGDDGREADLVATASTTTTAPGETTTAPADTVAGAATTTVTGSAAPAPTTPGSPPTTTAQPATTTAPSRPVTPPPVAVPAAGTYRYKVTQGEETTEGTTKIEDKGAAPNGGRSLVLTIAGQGLDSVSDVTWGPEEVRVLRSRFTFGAQSADCDWDPDHLELKLSLAVGVEWSSTSSCTVLGRKITRTSTAKVTEARRVRVAGEDVDVWVMSGTESIDGQQQGTGTTWFSPAHGIIVRSEATSPQGQVTLEVQNLRPV